MNLMAQSLKGKTAFITGAGKGIGKATAIALAEEGVNIGLMARTESDLKAVAEELESRGVKASYATADVSDMEQVNQAVEKLTADLGPADILINNAGIGIFGPFLEIDPAEWKKNDRRQFDGDVLCDTRCSAPINQEKRRGHHQYILDVRCQRHRRLQRL
jgi:3-oxoacyl-[acyl-carrier protein] reductase